MSAAPLDEITIAFTKDPCGVASFFFIQRRPFEWLRRVAGYELTNGDSPAGKTGASDAMIPEIDAIVKRLYDLACEEKYDGRCCILSATYGECACKKPRMRDALRERIKQVEILTAEVDYLNAKFEAAAKSAAEARDKCDAEYVQLHEDTDETIANLRAELAKYKP